MKSLLKSLLLVFLLFPYAAFSQGYQTFKDGWMVGLKDGQGRTVVSPRWEKITAVPKSDYYVVMLGGKYGILNGKGELVVPAKFSYIIPRTFGEKIVVNMGGEVISTSTYDIEIADEHILTYNLKGNKDAVWSGQYYPIEKTDWMPSIDNYLIGGKWGVYNLREFIPSISPSFDLLQLLPDEERYIGLGYTYSGSPNYNIYDTVKDNFVFDFQTKNKKIVKNLKLFHDGWALVNTEILPFGEQWNKSPDSKVSAISNVIDAVDAGKKYILLTTRKGVSVYDKSTGKGVINNITGYEKGTGSANITYVADSKGSFYVLTDNGFFPMPPNTGEMNCIGNFIMSFTGESPSIGIINTDGEIVDRTLIRTICFSSSQDTLYYISENGDLSMMSSYDYIPRKLYSGCIDFNIYESEKRYVKIAQTSGWNSLWGILDLKTFSIAVPCMYEDLAIVNTDYYYTVSSGLHTLRSFSDEKFSLDFYGLYIDQTIHDPYCWIKVDRTSNFSNLFSFESRKFVTEKGYIPHCLPNNPNSPIVVFGHYYLVGDGNNMGLVDHQGNEAVTFKYNRIFPYMSSEGFLIVTGADGKFGLVNPYTKVELPTIFEDVGTFSNGICPVKIRGFWGLADVNGEVTLEPRYKTIGDFSGDLSWLKKDNFPYGITYAEKPDGTLDWVDGKGDILCTTPNTIPSVKQIVSEGLWDF